MLQVTGDSACFGSLPNLYWDGPPSRLLPHQHGSALQVTQPKFLVGKSDALSIGVKVRKDIALLCSFCAPLSSPMFSVLHGIVLA